MKTLQNLDSQGLLRKIFQNKELEGENRQKSRVAAGGIWRPWRCFDVKELAVCLPARDPLTVVLSQGELLLKYNDLAK